MTDSDKRSVHTDALETLGQIHAREEKRDAIHLAVIPAVAHERLRPGGHVAVGKDGKKAFSVPRGERAVGIVDPFLTRDVETGERFWLVIYPRKITSLRHVWSHPAFEDEAPLPADVRANTDAVRAAEARIRVLASDLDCSYERLMEGAAEYLASGECLHFGFDLDYDWPAEEFWKLYAVVTGKPVPERKDGDFFFRCSC